MTPEAIADIVYSVLTVDFLIPRENFSWDTPLEVLQPEFKALNRLVLLEQKLREKFDSPIPLLENISTTFHTPMDINKLVQQTL